MQKRENDWGVIILVLFLFFPVGIWMISNKMNNEKHRYAQNGKALKILGIVLLCFIPVYLIGCITGDLKTGDNMSPMGVFIMIATVFGFGGGFAIYYGNVYVIRADVYLACVRQLYTDKFVSIEEVASKLKRRYDDVVEDLQGMINSGYIRNAQIDLVSRQLVIDQIPEQFLLVNCPHCGGQNRVNDSKTAVCAYCDSPFDVES